MPDGGSRAPYIIICNGRIDIGVAKNGFEMIRAASRAATDLVSYYGDKLTASDTLPISDLQHQMMDIVNARAVNYSASEMVDEMFALLDALEQKIGY